MTRRLSVTAHLSERTRWAIVMAFAIAMAWVEAASVLYIRALVDRIEPYQSNPLPINGALGWVELWREASTLVMLGTLGLLAGSTWRRRAGYAALAFGAWDIFYYVFLRIMSGWPRTRRFLRPHWTKCARWPARFTTGSLSQVLFLPISNTQCSLRTCCNVLSVLGKLSPAQTLVHKRK